VNVVDNKSKGRNMSQKRRFTDFDNSSNIKNVVGLSNNFKKNKRCFHSEKIKGHIRKN
jgi:hypothetical protein